MQSPAIHIHAHGDASVLQLVQVEVAPPGPGQVQIRHTAIGLNYADIYQREGGHGPHVAAPFPITLGSQGAGVVTALGEGVTRFQVGQTIAYIEPGAYQSVRNVTAARAVRVPEGFSDEIIGANLLRGLTAEYLVRRLYTVKPGDIVLVHAAAGGMGVILSQWANALGATVIGTVGSEAKAKVAREHGCHHVVNYREADWPEQILKLADGVGVHVVYDAVGKDVFLPSLKCVRPMGLIINYGTASGDVEAFDLQLLHSKSLSVCRPTLRTFIAEPQALAQAAEALFDVVRSGKVKLDVQHRYPLAEIQRAHRELESRMTTGAPVILP